MEVVILDVLMEQNVVVVMEIAIWNVFTMKNQSDPKCTKEAPTLLLHIDTDAFQVCDFVASPGKV